jgi:hypothetical protein
MGSVLHVDDRTTLAPVRFSNSLKRERSCGSTMYGKLRGLGVLLQVRTQSISKKITFMRPNSASPQRVDRKRRGGQKVMPSAQARRLTLAMFRFNATAVLAALAPRCTRSLSKVVSSSVHGFTMGFIKWLIINPMIETLHCRFGSPFGVGLHVLSGLRELSGYPKLPTPSRSKQTHSSGGLAFRAG